MTPGAYLTERLRENAASKNLKRKLRKKVKQMIEFLQENRGDKIASPFYQALMSKERL